MDVHHDVNFQERADLLEHPGVKKFGLSVATDGATTQKHPLLNFICIYIFWTQMLFMTCNDCTQQLAENGSKDAEYIATLMIVLIRALPHPRYPDLIVTGGVGDMDKFKRLVVGVFFWIYCIWCVSRLYNCVFRHAVNDKKITTLAEKGKMIVDRFGGSTHYEHSFSVVKSKGRALILYKDTRFGLYFIMLHRILVLRKVLAT